MMWYELLLLKSQDQLKLNVKKHEDMLLKDNKYTSLKICQIQAELFYILTWKQDYEIFTIMIKDIKKALELKLYTNSWLFVFEKYHDLINIFRRQNINKLPPH